MDGRSLEDKILKYDLSRVPDDDAGPRPDSDAGSGSEPDDDAIEQFLNMAAQDTQVEDPSKPSMRFAGTSKRGGPKGVMDDYKLAQADLERRRERDALQRLEALRVCGEGVSTDAPSIAFNSEGAKAARALAAKGLDEKDEVSEEEEEEEDDDFMRSYRESRLKEMARLSQLPRFGVVREIGQLDLVSETDDEDKRVWVIIHLYEDFISGCRAVNAVLPEVARAIPHAKFLRLKASTASDTLDHIALPTFMIFRAGDLVHAVIRLCDRLGATPTADDIEGFLAGLGVDGSG